MKLRRGVSTTFSFQGDEGGGRNPLPLGKQPHEKLSFRRDFILGKRRKGGRGRGVFPLTVEKKGKREVTSKLEGWGRGGAIDVPLWHR